MLQRKDPRMRLVCNLGESEQPVASKACGGLPGALTVAADAGEKVTFEASAILSLAALDGGLHGADANVANGFSGVSYDVFSSCLFRVGSVPLT